MSEDPITQLMEGSALLHEWFVALLDAGFTPAQASDLMAAILAATARGGAL